MPYVPRQAPALMQNFDELRKWVEEELRNLANSFAEGDSSTASGIAGVIPTGSVMLFWQTAAPTGWTKLTTQNDKALRVVSGSGGVSGGTNAFSTVMAQTVTGNTTLTAAMVPNLSVSCSGGSVSGTVPWISSGMNVSSNGTILAYGGGSTTVTSTGTMTGATTTGGGGVHSHPMTMSIQYIDIILASKN
jgi:hypothetical protein